MRCFMKKLNDTQLSNVIGGQFGDNAEWYLACATGIAPVGNATCHRIAREKGKTDSPHYADSK